MTHSNFASLVTSLFNLIEASSDAKELEVYQRFSGELAPLLDERLVHGLWSYAYHKWEGRMWGADIHRDRVLALMEEDVLGEATRDFARAIRIKDLLKKEKFRNIAQPA